MYLFREISNKDELGYELQQLVQNEAGEFISLSYDDFEAPSMILELRHFQFEDSYLSHEGYDITDVAKSFLLSLGEPYKIHLNGIDDLQYWEKLTLETTTNFVLSFLTKGVGGGSCTLDDPESSEEFWNNLMKWIGKPQCIISNWKRNSPYSGGSGFRLFKGKNYVHDEGFIIISRDKIGMLFFFGED
jgi:hypothetical protein